MEAIWALTLGVSLSACAGMRAIVPFFVLAMSHRVLGDWVPLAKSFEWVSSTPALIALGIATVVELLSDKIPALDNVLDVIQTPVRTAAGATVVAAPLLDIVPKWAVAIMVIIGGASALSVHSAKSALRAASTATTGGLANPIISLIEDGITWGTALAAIFIPMLVVVVVIVVVLLILRKARRLIAGLTGSEPSGEAASP